VTRYLGVDYGQKRVGLAISDGAGITARPLDVIAVDDVDETLPRIVAEYQIDGVVIGLPTSLGGYEGTSAEGAREMGERIGDLLGVPVTFIDERFTTRIAEEALLESGMKRRDRRETVDKVAAAIILQTFLDTRTDGNPEDTIGVETPESP
jgi:putative Holliday junction resolvase